MTDRESPIGQIVGPRVLVRDYDDKEHACWMKIRNGLRQMLQGVEELKGLPRSFETKKEQGRRVDTPG